MSGSASLVGSRMSSRPCREGDGANPAGVVSIIDVSPVGLKRGGRAAPVIASTRFSEALKTSAQRPQRTQPAETRNWSGTTRNTVLHDGQRDARAFGGVLKRAPPAHRSKLPARARGAARRPAG